MPRKKIVLSSLIILIFISGLILRFYHFTNLPPGLMQDEALAGFDAYSIMMTGKDHHGVYFPFTFQSFNDWIAHTYVYTLIPFVKIFGLNVLAIRLLPAILSIFTILLIYYWSKIVTGNNFFSLIPSLLFTFSWFSVTSSRWSIPPNTVPFYSTLSLLFFFLSLKTNRFIFPVLSGMILALSLYSYPSYEAMLPIWYFFSIFLMFKTNWGRKKTLYPIIVQFGFFVLFSTPLLLEHIKNPQTITNRLSMISVQSLSQNPLITYLSNYLSYYLPSPLFFQGEINPTRTIPGIGYENPLLSVFYYYGLFFLFFATDQLKLIFPDLNIVKIKILKLFILLFPILPALTLPAGDFQRATHFLPVFFLVTGFGVFMAFLKLKKYFINPSVVFLVAALAFGVYLISHIYFLWIYFGKEYRGILEWYFQNGMDKVVEFSSKNENKYEKIIIDNTINQPYIYVLFYKKFDPRNFRNEDYDDFSKIDPQTNWLKVEKFRNYEFRKINNEEISFSHLVTKIYNSPFSNYVVYENNKTLFVVFEVKK